jgi:hypothetical protein
VGNGHRAGLRALSKKSPACFAGLFRVASLDCAIHNPKTFTYPLPGLFNLWSRCDRRERPCSKPSFDFLPASPDSLTFPNFGVLSPWTLPGQRGDTAAETKKRYSRNPCWTSVPAERTQNLGRAVDNACIKLVKIPARAPRKNPRRSSDGFFDCAEGCPTSLRSRSRTGT